MSKSRALLSALLAAASLAACEAPVSPESVRHATPKRDEAPPLCRGPGMTMGGGYTDLPLCTP